VQDYVNIGGISEPEISQNKATADVRLREGEVNLIGGIIQQTDSKATTGIPGLASIPWLGRLFSGETVNKDRTELVIALIPHIVRGQEVSSSNLRGIAAGNATQIKVSYAPRPVTVVALPGAATPAPGLPPVTAPPVTPPAVGASPNPGAPPATAPPIPPVSPPPPPPGAGQARLSFSAPSPEAQLNSTVTVTLTAENIANLAAATAQLRFDPAILRLNSVVAGDLAQGNAAPLDVVRNILNDTGQADLAFRRNPGEGGASGNGGLFTIVFQAVGRGTTSVTLSQSTMSSPSTAPIAVTAPAPFSITVR
jgi:general secretion pathway protein D